MRRKPSASHWVKKLPLDTYSPLSSVFSTGEMRVSIFSSQASGMFGMIRAPSSTRYWLSPSVFAVARKAQQGQRLAIQPQRRIGGRGGIAPQCEHGPYARGGFVEVEVEGDVFDQEWRRLIVGKTNTARRPLGRDIAGIVKHCRHLWFAVSLPRKATTADASSLAQPARLSAANSPGTVAVGISVIE